MLHGVNNNMEDDDFFGRTNFREQESEICDACKMTGDPGSVWIGCDKCDKWYHIGCEGLNENQLPGEN